MADTKHFNRLVDDLFDDLLVVDDLFNEAAINQAANKIKEFFPSLARGHGGTHFGCNAAGCVINGGRNEHTQSAFDAAKTFVLSSSGNSAEE